MTDQTRTRLHFDPITRGDSAKTSRGTTLTSIVVGGRRLDVTYSPRCRVCNSPWRAEIDRQLLFMRGYKMILSLLPEDAREGESPITVNMIKNHASNGHLPINAAISNAMAVQRADELGRNLEEMTDTVIDYVLVGRSMLQRYMEGLMLGQQQVSGSDAVAVMRLMAQIDANASGSVSTEVYNQVFAVVLDTMRQVAPESFDEIVHRISEHPLVKSLIADRERQGQLSAG